MLVTGKSVSLLFLTCIPERTHARPAEARERHRRRRQAREAAEKEPEHYVTSCVHLCNGDMKLKDSKILRLTYVYES